MLVFAPDRGLSFDQYFGFNEKMDKEERLYSICGGLCPRITFLKYMDLSRVDLASNSAPSLWLGCQACSTLAVTEVIRILFQPETVQAAPHYIQFDQHLRKYYRGYLRWGYKNPMHRMKLKVAKMFAKKMMGKK